MKRFLTILILLCVAAGVVYFFLAKPETAEKEKMIWLDAHANFHRLSTKDSIEWYLDKAKESGFNKIVVDVRPTTGYAFYKSNILPLSPELKEVTANRDWDYLQCFIDEARRRGMKIAVSVNAFTGGSPARGQGIIYDDPDRWNGKTCVHYKKSGAFVDVKDDPVQASAALNPALPEVRDYCLSFIKEVVANYDVDALVLDYCRFEGEETDFSPATRKAFEEYLGTELEHWPGDVFAWKDNARQPGRYYKQWWTFRSKLIADFVKSVRTEIKAVKPDVQLEYWAASWIGALYTKGQNWASQSYDFSKEYPEWASPEYAQTGFAEYLDVFQLGAYLSVIYGMDNNESIEYAIDNAKKKIGHACKLYGTIYALNYPNNIEDAAFLSLSRTDGLMVFDVSQVIQFDQWGALKRAIARAEGKDRQ